MKCNIITNFTSSRNYTAVDKVSYTVHVCAVLAYVYNLYLRITTLIFNLYP